MTSTTAHRVVVDDGLAERLRVVVDELGARDLPIRAVIHALLVEAAERFEAAALRTKSFAQCRATEDGDEH